MKAKIEQFPAKNPNPAVSVGMDGTVLYSNEAYEPLLRELKVKKGEKLPSDIVNVVQHVISRKSSEKMEIRVGNRIYLVVFHPVFEQECVNISGFDISDQKELEERLRIKEKQSDVLYRVGQIAYEYESLQTFLDESVKLITSILELEYCKIMELLPDGKFLLRAGIGWKPGFVRKQIVEGGKRSQAGYTLLLGKPVIVEDFVKENRFEKPEILKIHSVASGASVIIGSEEKIFGVLIVNSTKRRRFTSDDTYFLNSVAFLIAQVIERKKAEEELKKSHDALEERIKERTSELENAYNLLKESEQSLAEAQEIAHIGNWSRDIVTGKVKWSDEAYRIFGFKPKESGLTYDSFLNLVHPCDLEFVINAGKQAVDGSFFEAEYRFIRNDGVERTVHEKIKVIFDKENNPIQLKGIVQDITEKKKAEEALMKIETARKQEIHHRIKNNLQVISSLLDLQADVFKNKMFIKESEVLDAFKESQDRVISMALIHEELYKGKEIDKINFSQYINELSNNLLLTYRVGNDSIILDLDIKEEILFDMDTAVPLGIIINELFSNSLKHAFRGREKGEIRIKLHNDKNVEINSNGYKRTSYILNISDNGIGIHEKLDIEDLDSLGLQLVTSLVDQLDGELEIIRNNGTEFIIKFTLIEETNQTSPKVTQLIF